MIEVLSGASVVAAAAIALFFLRFYRDTGDRFFALFALAFAIFAVNRIALTALDDESEVETVVYVMRALAFGVIVVAIVDKNRPASRASGG